MLKYRPDIDGLRAIAVVLVIIYHAFPNIVPGGFIGVDIFFVISGYLITSILSISLSNNKYSIKDFYRRRIDRLFPALLLVIFSVFIFGWFTLFPDEFMQLGKQLAGSAGFVSNIVFYSETGYFNATSPTKPLLHLWSLGIEEQFYLIFPLVLYLAYKRKVNILFIVVLLAAISFLLNILSINENVERTFYLPQYRHWELLFGAILSLIVHGEKAKRPHTLVAIPVAAVSLLVILITALTLNSTVAFPGWYALLPVLASVLLIWSAQDAGPIKSVISSKPFLFIGLISYPLYLWHWPLFSLAYIINGSTPPDWLMLLLTALSFLLATLTYYFIERPLKKVSSWKKKTIPMLVLMLIIGTAGYKTYTMNGIDNRSNIKISKEVSRLLIGPMWPYAKNDACLERFKTSLSSSLPWWFCSLKRNADPDVIILGNSYANHLYPGIANNTYLKDLNVLSIGIANVVDGVSGSRTALQTEQAEFINNIILHTKSIKYVLISGITIEADDSYINDLIERMSIITSNGAKVVIFYPHVQLSDDIKECFSRPLKRPNKECTSDLSELKHIQKKFSHLKNKVIKAYPETLFFDPNSAFCDENKCSSIKEGLPMYRDEFKHLSEFGSMSVGNEFAKWAKENLPELTK
ncbi:acyltransferase [Citrobacter braakii]|uniref:acyltransferase family protein n=1 Tax=Citrobacter braakii TaxID=57706 RepID=UPI001905959B|nr:acyltransferase family protein [Citrobacter braakii]MBJ9143433.1 acyltransferase [Citrobacter braakii]MBJ9570491.1 acyltransferase [Citrobacter braakii]